MTTLTTVSGKPVTIPISARLPIPAYQGLIDLAKRHGIRPGTMAAQILQERINESEVKQNGER